MRRVFAAFPFSPMHTYIEARIRAACDGIASVECAKDVLSNKHILDKIIGQMRDADLLLFDLSGYNVNVALELGIAIGAESNWRVVYDPSQSPDGRDVYSDMLGRDSVRYSSPEELESVVRRIVTDDRNYRSMNSYDEKAAEAQPFIQATVEVTQSPGQPLQIVIVLENVARDTVATDVRAYVSGVGSYGPIPSLPFGTDPVVIKDRFDDKTAHFEYAKYGAHAIVEFADRFGRYYKQVGNVKQIPSAGDTWALEMRGLGRPEPADKMQLLPLGTRHTGRSPRLGG